jgi:IclR family transcriptional regulator, acetate operon repressor
MANAIKPRPARRRVTDKEARDKVGQVQSLVRALSLLSTVARASEGLSLTDLSEMLRLAPSTAHRLLTTLQQEGFVRFDRATNLWQVGLQAFVVGSTFVRSRDVVAIARPYMRRLMEESGETVNLAIENEGEAVYLSQVECHAMMRAIARPGGRAKMHCSGVGKAILAWLPEARVKQILQRHGMPPATERTLTSPSRLRRDLESVRERGFAIDDEEHAVGLRCVAAPIFDEHGAPLAALSLSGPLARIDDRRLGAMGGLVRGAAEQVTGAAGGALPATAAA